MTAVIEVAAPPEVPRRAATSLLVLLLPVVMSVGTLAATFAAFVAGSPVARNPGFLAFPVMMVVSMVVTVVAGRGRRRGAAIDADRDEYLAYLSGLHDTVVETATAQYVSLVRTHPEPDTLWTLVGGPLMWGRQRSDPDFGRVRVGVGSQPLTTRLVAAPTPPAQRCDPVTLTALGRFLHTHSAIEAPIVIALSQARTVTIDGDTARVRSLLRALICQLAVFHSPEQLSIVGVVGVGAQWDWLKWLPHTQHRDATDEAGSARLVYSTLAQARDALTAMGSPRAVVILDAPADTEQSEIAEATILAVGRTEASVAVRHSADRDVPRSPDQLALEDAVVFARRLAAHGRRWATRRGSDWASLLGVGEVSPLCVPIGVAADGRPVHLDIKEAALRGMGPHGLCVGATGSGKSELLRTVALGMMASNSPEVLNLLLIDFKGGATFLEFAEVPHVAAVITNLADEASLVARMRDALAGEMNRRQQLLRTAGCVSVAAYQHSRAGESAALPSLFIIVDEFSELLSQHPEFTDTFVAIGRLGRSLGMHLLLASQRLDDGRLRGLEAHLSYRVCLKTLSASESRVVLGTSDAYELPTTPGAGLLRTASGELIRFQAAFVSGPAPAKPITSSGPPRVRRFTAETVGALADSGAGSSSTVMREALDRMVDQGPPAHRVWLPPLDAAPTVGALLRDHTPAELTVPIGIVDRPYQQARTPLTVELAGAAGNVAVVGAPQSGKSTALCTLIAALAATHDPGQVQFYCMDFGGGALSSIRALPHVGAVADRFQPELVGRMVAELASAVRTREAFFRDHGIDSIARYRQLRTTPDAFADVFLVVDGWAALRHESTTLEETITAIAAQGLSYGVHVVLSASRWAEIRPALKDQIGTRVELRLGDPADSELDRRLAREVPPGRPGRGLSPDGLHMLIALPALDGLALRRGASVAPPIPLLPTEVDYDTVITDDDAGAHILLGLGEDQLRPVAVDFDHHRHLLVLGDNGCGKTAALRTLCREIVRTNTAAQARLFIVDFRRTLLGVVESEHLGGYAMSPAALAAVLPDLIDVLRRRLPPADVSQAQLRARSWWAGPEVYVVADDYDLVATQQGNPLSVLLEYLPYAADLGLHVIAARRSGGAARALFEPLLASLHDLGCMAMMMSGRPDDGVLLGSRPAAPLPPGRGILITRPGGEQLVQVAWTPPA